MTYIKDVCIFVLASLGKRTSLFTSISLLLIVSSAHSQDPQAEHLSHHPELAAQATAQSQPGQQQTSAVAGSGQVAPNMQIVAPGAAPGGVAPPGGAGGMMAGMGEMMKNMGLPPKRDFYPSLVEIPVLTPERWDEIQQTAHGRMTEGLGLLSTGIGSLSAAVDADNFALMQQALAEMRQGMQLVESGISAHRLLAEGESPRNIALNWFKTEMNLASQSSPEERHSLLGLTPFHLFTMVLLSLFALVMIALYFFKMRRAEALFGRIDPDSNPPPPKAPPPGARTSGPSAPAAAAKPSGGSSDSGASSGDAAKSKNEAAGEPLARDSPAPPATSSAVSEATSAPQVAANWKGRLRIERIVTETPSLKTFRLVPSSHDRFLPFTFIPGQFLNVAFWIGGAKMNRSYSISSSPLQREYVELAIRREPRGAVSRHINDLLKVGDHIEVSGPVGKFTFTGAESDSIVLISAGIGVTPMMSITRYLTERKWPGEIFFIYSCRYPAEFIFADESALLQRVNPKLHVAVTVTKPEGTDWKGFRGRVSKEWLTRVVPGLTSRRIHICGPQSMMDSTKTMLAELGVSADLVKTEAFGLTKPAPAAAGTTSKPTAPATGPEVTFSKNNKSAKIRLDLKSGDSPPEQTILELSEELGIGIEFSCRVGTCGLCKVKMTSGEVDQEVQDALDENEKANGIILACQAKPKSEVTVEA